ncbi:hypothetical protein BOW53_11215 [Solemya pervernicosa gill symbiont]|uniref:undecaprenyl-diphosphate phosphatase n=1 Tax=Solemya pervernicosa gill symbiont TaxID=642797 RepID=A0A1T2L3F9_9GAMM|nr:phosphatase PAP2 family protein [Solemya pervernicosa gill symbiont]OOZ39476.1 hypothetical protein BOW53_11215 [Solemya pervernicosa gill symbiont]
MSGLDDQLLLWINQGWAHPWLDLFFSWISDRKTFSLPLVGLLLVISLWKFGSRGLLLWLTMVLVVIGSDRIGNVLKNHFAEPRPCYELSAELRKPGGSEVVKRCEHSTKGLPSNHTFNFFAMALFMSFFLRGWGWRTALIGVSLLVAISRIYLAKHYPSQVGVGLLLGVSYGFVLGWLVVRFIPYLRTLHQRAGGAIRIKKGEWL